MGHVEDVQETMRLAWKHPNEGSRALMADLPEEILQKLGFGNAGTSSKVEELGFKAYVTEVPGERPRFLLKNHHFSDNWAMDNLPAWLEVMRKLEEEMERKLGQAKTAVSVRRMYSKACSSVLKTNGNEQIRECLRESLKTVEKLVIPRRKYIGKVEYHRKPPSERALGPTNRRKKQGGSGRGQQDRRPGTLHLEKQGPSGGRKRGKRYQDNGERAIQRAAEGEESGKKRRKVNGRPGLARGQDGELPPDVQFIEGAPRETPTEVEKGPTSGPTEVAIQRQKTIPTLIESQVDSDGANVDEPEQPEKHPEQPGVDTEVSKQRGVADKGPPSEAALEEEAQQQGIEELQEGMAPPQVEEGGAEEVVRYQQNTGKSGLDTLVAAAFVGGDPKPGKSLDSRPVETGQTEHGQGGRVSPMARRDENLDTPQSQAFLTPSGVSKGLTCPSAEGVFSVVKQFDAFYKQELSKKDERYKELEEAQQALFRQKEEVSYELRLTQEGAKKLESDLAAAMERVKNAEIEVRNSECMVKNFLEYLENRRITDLCVDRIMANEMQKPSTERNLCFSLGRDQREGTLGEAKTSIQAVLSGHLGSQVVHT